MVAGDRPTVGVGVLDKGEVEANVSEVVVVGPVVDAGEPVHVPGGVVDEGNVARRGWRFYEAVPFDQPCGHLLPCASTSFLNCSACASPTLGSSSPKFSVCQSPCSQRFAHD
jgi:hypothetical protein